MFAAGVISFCLLENKTSRKQNLFENNRKTKLDTSKFELLKSNSNVWAIASREIGANVVVSGAL